MAFGPPDESDLASIGERYGLELSSADVASFLPFATGLLSSWTAVEELVRAHRAESARRPSVVASRRSGQPARRLVRDDRDPGDRRRSPRRANRGDQGQRHGRRCADDERLGHRRGLRADSRRHGGHAAPGGRRDDHGQGGVRGPVLLGRQPHVADRARAQPVGPDALRRRVLQRQRRPRRRRRRRSRPRRRPGRLGTDPQCLQRHRRSQADARPRPVHGGVPDRADARPPRTDHPHRR